MIMGNRITLFFFSLFLVLTTGHAADSTLINRTDWYVDIINGDDTSCSGSEFEPFKSINALLEINEAFPGFLDEGDTIHLSSGDYSAEDVVIDIENIKIQGTLDERYMPVSGLGEVTITADKVTLSNCLFLDGSLTLQGAEGVLIVNNVFSGKTKNSLTLLGSSNNNITNNRFESATGSCVVIGCDSKSKQASNDNIFRENYFTHPPEETTRQAILVNYSSFIGGMFGKKRPSARNRFIKCAFEETVPGQLRTVVQDHSTWRIVVDKGYSIKFEDCYFKKADRNGPFISFMIVDESSQRDWYWDELINDTWIASNKGDVLTGNAKNDYTPAIQFVDWDGDGLFLETNYFAGLKESADALSFDQFNSPPSIVDLMVDIAVYKNAEPNTINLYEVFEDDATADENLTFTVSSDNKSLVKAEIEDGLLTLSYNGDASGMALITVTATDDDSEDPRSSKDSFHVIVIEDTEELQSGQKEWYVDVKEGNDKRGTGSQSNPFKSIDRVLDIYAGKPDLEDLEDTIYLSKGKHGSGLLRIDVPGLTIKGTLDEQGRPATILGETEIQANGVKLMNCEFKNAGLKLSNVEDVLISNNVFSGKTYISLSIVGASNNAIQHNEFHSAIHDCVHIFWDPESERSSNDNVFFRNYFTHRYKDTTSRVIRVRWFVGVNHSISARNRFVECAFEETINEHLFRVIDDDSTWWVVAEFQYSVRFEDCYFKRANRAEPFSEFVVIKGHPDFTWRWDELMNDQWVSTNEQWAITGDHSGWHHKPRVQFIDANGNGTAFEMKHNAGLLSIDTEETNRAE